MRNSELIAEIRAMRAEMNSRLDAVNGRLDGLHTRIDTLVDALAELRRDFATHTHE